MKRLILFLVLILNANSQAASSSGTERGIGLTVNFPHVYNLSYESLSKSDRWSWGAGFGVVPTIHFTSGSSLVGIATSNMDVRGRWHPFAGGFFLGLALGYQTIKGSGTQNIDVSGQPVPTLVEVSINNFYLTPHLGWIWTPGSFMFGFEIGSQSGFGGNSKLDLSITDPALQGFMALLQADPDYQAFENNIEDGFAKFGNLKVVYVAVRLGFMF